MEHRLFSRITMNWRGRPLTSHEVIVQTIAATTTRAGLRVHAELDSGAPDPFDQPSPDLAWLCHPALTGLPAQQWDSLVAMLITLHDQQRETSLDKRRGHRPRLAAPGTGRRPVLTLAGRLLATILYQRLALPQTAIATLFSVRPETISKRVRDLRQLLDQAGHAIQPGQHRLASLNDLLSLATAEGIIAPPEIKTAC